MRNRLLRDDERRAGLRLARIETIGPATFASLIARYADVREALDAVPRLARRGGTQELRVPAKATHKRKSRRSRGLAAG
jgi:DNA processing protein